VVSLLVIMVWLIKDVPDSLKADTTVSAKSKSAEGKFNLIRIFGDKTVR
jgi:hypothetical protein